tara:strand:- start:769 stop:1167 length:399 start_codon:yes stop_codon:yes gene_type:complete
MGMHDDDEELFVSRSSEKTFKNPDQAKKEAREQKAKSKGKLLGLKRLLLSNTVGGDVGLKAAEADAETKRQQRVQDEADKHETFGTKTHKQIEEAENLSGDTELDAEHIMEMEKQDEEAKKEAGEEYAGDAA